MRVPFVDLRSQFKALRGEVNVAIADVFDRMDLFLGADTRALEAELAVFCRAEHAVAVRSGADALYLALRACGVSPNDEVITAANTDFSVTEAISRLQAVPVYVDVDPVYYTLDPELIEAAISRRTRAIVPVHLFGQMADMPGIMNVAQRYGLSVIEDARQACGAEQHGLRAGSVGDAGVLGFAPEHNLGAYGSAGAIVTSSGAIAREVALLRQHGRSPEGEYREIGIGSDPDEVQSAILRVKLRRLDDWNAERQELARRYDELLSGTNVVLPQVRPGATHVFCMYPIQVDGRDRLQKALTDLGVESRAHYPVPVYQQPAVDGQTRQSGSLSVTERLAERMLSLPLYPELEDEQLAYVAKCIRGASMVSWPGRLLPSP